MHIPDGYISPQTAGGLWALMIPAWYTAGYKVKRALETRQAPLLAIGAAFVFVIMMFNVPLPGGTSGHAVGGALVAVVLGPWAAVIAITVALAIQALFFGDGGILALGANCFNMAVALPLSSYAVYRLISVNSQVTGMRRWLGAGVGAYIGLNVAALLTALEIGIQPALFHAADGTALYSPYGLAQALPAMMSVHLAIIGFIEAAVTGLVVLYLQKTNPGLLGSSASQTKAERKFELKPLIIGLALLFVFTPLGLLAVGGAWGEWSPDEVESELGFLPSGMEKFSGLWSGILPDYAFPNASETGFWGSVPAYLVSAAVGMAVVAALSLVIIRFIGQRRKSIG